MSSHPCSAEVEIVNRQGFHARPASLFVQMAMTFQSEIQVCNLTNEATADGKSVISLLMLAAPCGTKLRITASGADEEQAVESLRKLVLKGFNDD